MEPDGGGGRKKRRHALCKKAKYHPREHIPRSSGRKCRRREAMGNRFGDGFAPCDGCIEPPCRKGDGSIKVGADEIGGSIPLP